MLAQRLSSSSRPIPTIIPTAPTRLNRSTQPRSSLARPEPHRSLPADAKCYIHQQNEHQRRRTELTRSATRTTTRTRTIGGGHTIPIGLGYGAFNSSSRGMTGLRDRATLVNSESRRCFSLWPGSSRPTSEKGSEPATTTTTTSASSTPAEPGVSSTTTTTNDGSWIYQPSTPAATTTPPIPDQAPLETVTNFGIADSLGRAVDHSATFFHSYFDTIHTVVGLPWYLTIPLSAIIIRSSAFWVFILPGLRAQARRYTFLPRLKFSRHSIRYTTMNKYRSRERDPMTVGIETGTAKVGSTMAGRPIGRTRLWSTISGQIDSTVGSEQRKYRLRPRFYNVLPFMPIPVFLCALDALRQMAGVPPISFFGLRQYLGDKGGSEIPGKMAESIQSAIESASAASASTTEIPPIVQANPIFDPSLSHGGCLWFSDLTTPDPTGLLSLGIFGAMWLIFRPKISNIIGLFPPPLPPPTLPTSPIVKSLWTDSARFTMPEYSFPMMRRPDLREMSLDQFLSRTRGMGSVAQFRYALNMPQFAKKTDRLSASVAVAIAVMSTQLPAGLVLYWIANSLTATLLRLVVRRRLNARLPPTIEDSNGSTIGLEAGQAVTGSLSVLKSRKLDQPMPKPVRSRNNTVA